LHGGSASYFIGTFDGETFTTESPKLRYAEGKNRHGDDTLYAAQSFVEMPDARRVQMAWGRVEPPGMPFNQVILFPTEFKLRSTKDGLRLCATPIEEIARLRKKAQTWSALSLDNVNQKLRSAGTGPLDIKLTVTMTAEDTLTLRYEGAILATMQAADLENGSGSLELLIDKSVVEIFVNQGSRYIVTEAPPAAGGRLECSVATGKTSVRELQIYQMKSIW
jgi:sucrose-6-phosphate hydrolase SacC (GH32 family)